MSIVLFLVGALILLAASIGLLHAFRGQGVTFGQLASSLLVIGTAASVGFYGLGAIEYQMATSAGSNRTSLAAFVDQSEEGATFLPIFILFILGIVLGLILLGIAAWRRGIVPVWGGLLIVVAGVLAFVSEGGVLSIVSFVFLLAGLGWLGVSLLRMSDDEWEAGGRVAHGSGRW